MNAAETFWAKVEKTDTCWLWTANTRKGYGMCFWSGKTRSAHRVAYEMLVGPIPTGLVLDHLCRNTACVNPDHLEAVTQTENVRRGAAANRAEACGRGHSFTEDNTYIAADGRRQCKACTRERRRKERIALRERGLTARGTEPVHQKNNDRGRRPDLGESVSRRPQEVTVMDECTCGRRGICASCAMASIEAEYDRDPFAQALEHAVDVVTRPANVRSLPGYSRRVD